MLIRAALTRAPGKGFVIEDVELAEPRADEVLVRVAAAGVCHTDLSCADGDYPVPTPIVLGHEGAGTVAAAGDSVSGFEPGDRVVMSFESCGSCRQCRIGRPAYCADFMSLNFGGGRGDRTTAIEDGGGRVHSNFFGQSSFATYALCRARGLVKLPADVPFEVAAPLGCGVQTGAGAVLNTLRVPAGSALLVLGTGGVGMSAVMAGRLCGAGAVVAVDPVESRRQLALDLGADAALDPAAPGFEAELVAVTGGFDFAVDTSGQPSVITQAFNALRPGGTLALIGGPATPEFSFDAYRFLEGRGVRGLTEGEAVPQEFVPMLLDHWRRGRFPVDRLITPFAFEDMPAAVASMRDRSVIKPVLTMS